MYQAINRTDGFIEESNGNKYLVFDSADKNELVLTKYTELWVGLKMRLKQ